MFYPKEICSARQVSPVAPICKIDIIYREREARSLAVFTLVVANAHLMSPPNVGPSGGVLDTKAVSRQNQG